MVKAKEGLSAGHTVGQPGVMRKFHHSHRDDGAEKWTHGDGAPRCPTE